MCTLYFVDASRTLKISCCHLFTGTVTWLIPHCHVIGIVLSHDGHCILKALLPSKNCLSSSQESSMLCLYSVYVTISLYPDTLIISPLYTIYGEQYSVPTDLVLCIWCRIVHRAALGTQWFIIISLTWGGLLQELVIRDSVLRHCCVHV